MTSYVRSVSSRNGRPSAVIDVQARVVLEPHPATRCLAHLRVDLDAVDLDVRVELAEGARDGAACVPDHEHPLDGTVEERRHEEEGVPDAAGEHRVLVPYRVDGDALVQLERARAVGALDDLDVLVGGLRLEEEPRARLDRPGGDEEEPERGQGQELPAVAEQERRGEDEQDGGAEHRPLRPQERDRHDRREKRPHDASHRRERVEPAGDGARLPHVHEREPDGEGRDGAEQRDRHGEERERRKE